MSLLSDTQGRPHTVRALVRTMQALGGQLPKDHLARWFLPGVFRGIDSANVESRIGQALGCARSLGWIETDGTDSYRLVDVDLPTEPESFLDHVHSTLCATGKPEDRRVLEAYSVLVLEMELQGSSDWLRDWTNKRLADHIDQSIRHGGEATRLFGPSKVSAWKAWAEALGLGWDSATLGQFLPDPVPRLRRELPHLASQFGHNEEIPPHDFIEALGHRMPYLDGGSILADVGRTMKRPLSSDRATLVLARALRELEDDDELELVSRGDAAAGGLTIPAVGIKPKALVVGVVIRGGRE